MAVAAVAEAPQRIPTTDPATVRKLILGILQLHEAITGHPFYTYQYVFSYRIIEALLTDDDDDRMGSTITGLWSRQSGKTSCVAELIVTLAIVLPALAKQLPQVECLQKFTEGLKVAIFAPIDQQAKISYDKMRDVVKGDRCKEIMADDEIDTAVDTNRKDQLSFTNQSLVVARSASPDSSVEGISGLHLILIDEAQGVDGFKVEKEIEPMRAATNGIMVKIGTAAISRGGFKSDIEANLAAYRAGLAPRNHFEFPYDMVVKEKREMFKRTGKRIHLAYEKYVNGQRIKMGGEKSPAFRMNFLLKWQEARMDAVSDQALNMVPDRTRQLNFPSIPDSNSTWVRVAGIDVGKGVNDPTVVTINEFNPEDPIQVRDEKTGDVINLYHHYFIGMQEFEGNFEDLNNDVGQYSSIVTYLRQWNVRRVTIDATNIGDPVYERFKVLASEIDWEPYKYTLPTKSNLFKYYFDQLEGGRVHVAAAGSDQDLSYKKWFEEHKTLQKEYVGGAQNYMRVHAPEPKSKLKRLPGEREFHDDYPNSSALAVWASKGELMMEIHVDQPSGYTADQRQRNYRSTRQQRYGGR